MIIIDFSPQEAFDKVKTHLLKQQRPAFNDLTNKCMYRGPNGTMCAVGCLIPDAQYSNKLEGQNISTLGEAGLLKITDADTYSLLGVLQVMHDQHSPSEWPRLLKEYAQLFKLEYKNEDASPCQHGQG